MRMVSQEAFSAHGPFVFTGPTPGSRSQTPRRADSTGMPRGVVRGADSPSQKHASPLFVQQFSEFVASVASHRSQSQTNYQTRSNSSRQKHQQNQQQQQQHRITERRASTPRGTSTRQHTQRQPQQEPSTPSLHTPPRIKPVHAGTWTPQMVFVDASTASIGAGLTQDPANMTPPPLPAPNAGQHRINWQDCSMSSIGVSAGLATPMKGTPTPRSTSYSSLPTLPPAYSDVASVVTECITPPAVAHEASLQNPRTYGQTVYRQHVSVPYSTDEAARTAKFSGVDHFATWTKAREVAEVVLQRADTSTGSVILVPEDTARALSEPPGILSRLYALRNARRRLSAGRRISKVMALKAELRLQSTLDAWRVFLREARHRQDMRRLERRADAAEVKATHRAERWQRGWVLRQTLGCWRSYTVSAMLARRPKQNKARWQRPTLADQVAVVLQRIQLSAGLLRVLLAWNRFVIFERRISAEHLVSSLTQRCHEQNMHIITSVTFRIQVGALLSGWKRVADLAWRDRTLQLLAKKEERVPDATRPCDAEGEARTASDTQSYDPEAEARFAAASKAGEWFRKVIEERLLRDALLTWCSCVCVAHAKTSLNSIADQMHETCAALADLAAASHTSKLKRTVVGAWRACLPSHSVFNTISNDSLIFSLDSCLPACGGTVDASMTMQNCTLVPGCQASATLPSTPSLRIHQPFLDAHSGVSGLSESLPASLLNRMVVS